MMNYFAEVKTIEELKKAYFKAALENHPDHGGDVEVMKMINNEYAELQKKLKDVHKAFGKDEIYTATKTTSEVPEDFINIVHELLKMQGVKVELCGRWLYISGNTYPNKGALKALGCIYCGKKKLWTWHYPEDSKKKFKGKAWDMDKIRNEYGSMTFEQNLQLGA